MLIWTASGYQQMKTGRFFDIREIEGNLRDLKLRLFFWRDRDEGLFIDGSFEERVICTNQDLAGRNWGQVCEFGNWAEEAAAAARGWVYAGEGGIVFYYSTMPNSLSSTSLDWLILSMFSRFGEDKSILKSESVRFVLDLDNKMPPDFTSRQMGRHGHTASHPHLV